MNEKILLTIKRIGINGEGIGFYKKKVVFVDGALPGEVVEIEITETTDKYLYGKIVKFKAKSPDRVEPKCPYYDKCGGCQLQHLAYPAQLEVKKAMVYEAFEKYYEGDLEKVIFNDTLGMENPWRYRNKASLPTRHDGEKVVTGMYCKNTNRLVYIDDCIIENELVRSTVDYILKFLSRENVDVYNPRTHSGSLKYIVVRAFKETKETQVTLVLNEENRRLINSLKHMNVTSANYTINSDPKSIEIFGNKIVNVAGKEQINGKLGNLDFTISPRAFFQLNTEQINVLYDEIKKVGKFNEKENVVDCYCGIGSIGMYLAPFVNEVRGIDINKQGIEDAKEFAKINGLSEKIKFYCGDIINYLDEFKEVNFKIDTIIVDPPRKGLDLKLINYLAKSKIRKIVYVSCNPSTLVKNINHLQKQYVVRTVTPIDMFPQTAGVESVVLLEKR